MAKMIFGLTSLVFLLSSCASPKSQKIDFRLVDLPENPIEHLGIRGSMPPLSWDTTYFLEEGHASVHFTDSTKYLEYKYVIDNGEEVTWESIDNRQLSLKNGIDVKDSWNKSAPIDLTDIEPINSKDLLQDLELVKLAVREVIPGTYRYSTKEAVEEVLEETDLFFQKDRSLGEAYLALSKITAVVQCDHTKVGFNNQGKLVNAVIHEQADKVPFTFKWFDNRMFVDLDATSDRALEHGVEVLSINGIDVADILKGLLPYVAADGATDHNRVAKLEVDGYDFRYNAFDVFFPLKFPLTNNTFLLQVLEDGKARSVEVVGMHREGRAKVLAERYTDFPLTRDDTWHFRIEDEVGVLTLNSFGLMGWKAMTIDYKEFLKKTFEELKEKAIEKLIIDIRKNTGGMDEMKVELFSYLPINRTSISLFEREGRTRFTYFPDALRPHIKTWGDDPWYYNLEPDRRVGDYYVFQEEAEYREPKEAKDVVFSGQVILLSSALNTSLAFYTARDFKQFEIGRIVGQETGGNQREINGGQIIFFTLPHSGIEIDFPVMGAFAKEDMPNRGVIPDVITTINLTHFKERQDIDLQTAKELLAQE